MKGNWEKSEEEGRKEGRRQAKEGVMDSQVSGEVVTVVEEEGESR